ncbi:tyrosine-type recombinase/integrase [Mycobacteroides abscessus subsp. bolletii]|uniref:tyrosine-type recombinase/integrase n=1 Tax=Mycobacteroides abscessus TaxID=36809 RepID=UPI0019D03D51|nr:site-specific integrase [Mycobacteroides abscessus]MBN7304334.1 tyrosine-type recombinase/integrase [Mycobacteroides abscessus subsp. bolletii]
MSKRSHGEGSFHQRPNGSWQGRLSYVDQETGARRRLAVYGKTKAETRTKIKAAQERLDAGSPVKDATRSVGDWLAQWRDTALAASDRKESTRALYANLSRKHLEGGPFGAITLDKLKPSDIDTLVLALRAQTKVRGDEKIRRLSDSTVRQVYTVLRAALDDAVRDGLLARNPAALVKRPGVERKEARHLDAGEVTAVLNASEGLRHRDALVLIAATGLRKGEALALRWDAVDLDKRVLKVSATLGRIGNRLVITEPKTTRSRRIVPLSPAVVTMLKRHKATQAAERLRAANQWIDNGLVFTTEFGTPADPRNLLRTIEIAAEKAGIKGAGVHTLRHSAAVAWLESGVHIKAVADLLGHSSISITGDVYGHTSDDTARAAVDGLATTLGL